MTILRDRKSCNFAILAGSFFVALLIIGNTAFAAEPAEARTPEEESTSDALMESLLGDDPLEPAATEPAEPIKNSGANSNDDEKQLSEYARLAQKIRDELGTAQTRLAEGETGEPTQAAQAEAIAATERLIELAKQSANSSNGSQSNPPQSPSAGQGGSGAAGGGEDAAKPETQGTSGATPDQMAGNRNREGKADDSSPRSVEERDPQAVFSTFRATVIERSWGHLPERMRTRLLNGGGDKTLPRYETLVNQYFESLVRPDPDDSLGTEE